VRRAALASRLGLPRLLGTGGFLLALLVDALGTGFFTPILLLYVHVVAGLPLPAIGGVVLTVATILTLPLTPLTGALVDRFGARRLVIASHLFQAMGFLGYLAVGTIPALLVTALLVRLGVTVAVTSRKLRKDCPEGSRPRAKAAGGGASVPLDI